MRPHFMPIAGPPMTAPFDDHESAVRTYSRQFPAVFTRGHGHHLEAEDGRVFVDLLSGAGALNYGHNHPHVKRRVIEYIEDDGVVHSLDLHTTAKRSFVEAFVDTVLRPRGMDHKLLFTGPTGANAVEAALKVARRATGRTPVVAFTNGFHGLSLGALAATASAYKRGAAGVTLDGVVRMPYDGFIAGVDSMDVVEAMFRTAGNGIDPPAAFIVEAVQGEGGLACASRTWVQRLAALASDLGSVLILDEIQTGCGRTGSFFGFDAAGIVPDIICLSKSLSGLGLPMAMVLVDPRLDVLLPGEHSGTFRGNNLAFVGATAALDFWRSGPFVAGVDALVVALERSLAGLAGTTGGTVRGRGLLRGIAWEDESIAPAASRAAFDRGVLVETVGPRRDVLKVMPPLTMPTEELVGALERVRESVESVKSVKSVGARP